ncbi:MAG: hypothetical protein JXQ75_21680 [Phycisphaerae bacterium]|nr:hypothetical protein [Phycisphaerae bacterium]
MPQERNAVKVGVVTVFIVAVFFVILMWISQRVGGEMQTIVVRFKSTPTMPTLTPGSPVLVGGHKVGKVVDADLRLISATDPNAGTAKEAFYLVVEVEIRSDLKLRTDCKVFAEGPPLGGDGLLKIDLGSASEAIDFDKLADGMIEGSDPAGFSAILASLQSEFDGANPDSLLGQIKSQLDPDAEVSLMAKLMQSLTDINQVTAALARELEPDQKAALLAKIHDIVDNISDTTGALRAEFETRKPTLLLGKVHLAMDTVNEGLTTITRMLKTNEPPVTRTIQHLETTAANIAAETDPAKADSLIAHFKEASRRLNASLADINTVTDTTRQVVVLNRENINRLLLNFKESSDHIKTGVKYVLRHPWRLLNEPSTTEVKQQAIFDATRSFTEAATRIDDAAAQLRALTELHQGSIPADDPDLARIAADLRQTQEKYREAEVALWRQLGVD